MKEILDIHLYCATQQIDFEVNFVNEGKNQINYTPEKVTLYINNETESTELIYFLKNALSNLIDRT